MDMRASCPPLLTLLLISACSAEPPPTEPFPITPLQPEAQRSGDAAAGYKTLVAERGGVTLWRRTLTATPDIPCNLP